MGAYTGTVLAIASLVAGTTGAVMSYQSSQNAAATQETFALMNSQAETQAARQKGALSQQQSLIQSIQSENAKKQGMANAVSLREDAEAQSRISQENTRRTRDDFARLMATQRARLSKSGIVDTTGTPLDLLAETAAQEQMTASEMGFQNEIQRRALFREADMQELQGNVAGFDAATYRNEGLSAVAGGRVAASQSRMNMYGQFAAASGTRMAATGQAISDAGSLADKAYNYSPKTPRKAYASTS